MISGYFVAGSYDRYGFNGFVLGWFKRLIITTLIYMLALDPFIGYIELGNKFTGFSIIGFLSGTGVMWFAVALFAFSLIYAVARLIGKRSFPAFVGNHVKPSLTKPVILILVISACAVHCKRGIAIYQRLISRNACFN